MITEGWIKLHRRFLEWEWFDSEVMVKLWVYLLLEANHEDKKWRGYIVRRGQIVTSLSDLSVALKISMRTVRTCLSRLEQTGEIDKQATNRYTILTICNYDKYQVKEESHRQASDNPTTNDRQTNDKQTTTNKNNKNNKKDINNSSLRSELCPSETDEVLTNRHCQNIVDFWNKTIVETNSILPQVKALSEKRKLKMRLRWSEFKKLGDPVEVCRTIFHKVCSSKFCQGDNERGWSAKFDWIFKNPENWLKVYEGSYDDRPVVVMDDAGEQVMVPPRKDKLHQMIDERNKFHEVLNGITYSISADGAPDRQFGQ